MRKEKIKERMGKEMKEGQEGKGRKGCERKGELIRKEKKERKDV